MNPSKTIFLAFPIGNTAVSDFFTALANELIKRKYSVVLITPGKQIDRVTRSSNPAIYTWPSVRPTKIQDAIFLAKLIRKYKPSLIIANFAAVNISLIVGFLMRVPLRIATYHTAYDFFQQKSIFKRMKDTYQDIRKIFVYKFASFLLPVSEAMAREVESIYHVPTQKVHYFHNALKDPNLEKPYLGSANKRILCVGKLCFGKGQDILLRAIKIIYDHIPDLRLLIIGDGPSKSELKALTEELELLSITEFSGSIPHQEVLNLMNNSYAVIVPSRFEAFSYVIIESFSVGTPVIASSVGGIPELIRDKIEGFLVPPGNPQILAQRLMELLMNNSLYEKMSLASRNRFVNNFEINKAVQSEADWLDQRITQYKKRFEDYFSNYENIL